MTDESTNYYEALLARILKEIKNDSVMVAGALGINTDQFDGNLKRMKDQMALLAAGGLCVFDQTPYLDIYHPEAPRDYAKKFDIFYKGIIQSGRISKLFVLPGYEEARGVISEIEYAKEKGIPIEYLQ